MGIVSVALIAFSIVSLFSIGLTSQLAYGTIQASGGAGTSVQTMHSVSQGPCAPGSPPQDGCAEDIIETVSFCPTCGPWVKTFNATDLFFGQPAQFGFVLHVHEFLSVQGTDWNDWHEKIITPGWIYNITLPTTPIITTPAGVTPTIVPMNPNELWIDFDPPLNQTQTTPQLTIFKYMVCDNPSGCDPVVVVEQFPTIKRSVGGALIEIDTTALLLAGVQSISMWMIPVVAAGVVIGIFVIKRRK